MSKWALIGNGFIASRHIQAIKDIGDELVMVCDSDDKKRAKTPDIPFYNNIHTMMEDPSWGDVEWVAVCTPNYLHPPMVLTLVGKNILCEKPLVITTEDLERIKDVPNIYTVLQLRHNPELQALKKSISPSEKYQVELTMKIHRGEFYNDSWKVNPKKSGGLLYNIGVHYFDLLLWLFGDCIAQKVYTLETRNAAGLLIFKNAEVKWVISLDAPMDNQLRQLKINDKHFDLGSHFEDLHTKVYKDVKAGKGIKPKEAGRAIQLVEVLNKIK